MTIHKQLLLIDGPGLEHINHFVVSRFGFEVVVEHQWLVVCTF